MNRQGNTYTFVYAIVLVVVVAALLSIIALSLQPAQNENIKNENARISCVPSIFLQRHPNRKSCLTNTSPSSLSSIPKANGWKATPSTSMWPKKPRKHATSGSCPYSLPGRKKG